MLGIPLVLLAAFCFSAAEITATDESLRYRRFFRWQKVDYGEIRDCRVAWFLGMGRLKLNHSVAPWGTIYFLLPLEPFEVVFPGRQSKFTAFVNARRGKNIQEDRRGRQITYHVMFIIAGVAYMFLFYSLFPNFPPRSELQSLPEWVRGFMQFERAALGWPWGVLTSIVLLLSVIRFRSKRRSWILAFCLGAVLTSVAIGALH